MRELRECEIAERFLDQADDESFNSVFRVFSPQVVAMTLRFIEECEYHEIAAALSIPISTAQWRVFNRRKKLAAHLSPVRNLERKAA